MVARRHEAGWFEATATTSQGAVMAMELSSLLRQRERGEYRGRRKKEGRRQGMVLDLWPAAATLVGRSGDLGNGFGRR